jgi:L-ascorbate metabolism protein UlaG (beta-lactamase superfamily)
MIRSVKMLLVLFLLPILSHSQGTCKITYISNEGFLVEVQGKKVLIDGLFDQIDGDWCDSPTEQMVELMERAAAPFDQVNLIAITHNHRDHFDEHVVVNHLLQNPRARVICPLQVREVLEQNPEFVKIKDQIVSLTPMKLYDSTIVVSEISVRVMRLEHSYYMEEDGTGKMINRHRDVENLGYLFDIGGMKVFHCGDTNPQNREEYSAFALQNDSIDVAFLERMFAASGMEGMDIVNQFIQPEHIVFMHIGPANRETFLDHFREVDNVTIFEEKMDSIKFDFHP